MISKADMNLNLLEVERLAQVAMESDEDVDVVDVKEVSDELGAVAIAEELDESDTTETDDGSTDSDDVTSESDDVIVHNAGDINSTKTVDAISEISDGILNVDLKESADQNKSQLNEESEANCSKDISPAQD